MGRMVLLMLVQLAKSNETVKRVKTDYAKQLFSEGNPIRAKFSTDPYLRTPAHLVLGQNPL